MKERKEYIFANVAHRVRSASSLSKYIQANVIERIDNHSRLIK
jgi:hypothetical protein